MARIRSVKPSLRTSRVVASWPREVRYAWVLLWGYLDDEGRGLDSAKAIAGDCFPLDDDVTPAKMERWLNLFATTSKEPDKEPPLCRYEINGTRYLHAVNWGEHQRPNRPKPSVHPPCLRQHKFSESSSDAGTNRFGAGGGELGGGELEGSAGVTEPLTAAAGAPPPRTCPKHPDGTETPCRACQAARKTREAWDAAEPARRQALAAAIAALRGRPACPHGDPGGASPHPVTGEPLCPLCRRQPSTQEDQTA